MKTEKLHKLLLKPDISVYTALGKLLGVTFQGKNPGRDYLRFALTAPLKQVETAAERIEKHLPKYL